MKIIGFSGGMGVGKSTAIRALQDKVDSVIYNVKFAQPLYDMQEFIYNRIESVHQRHESFTKDRKLLQWLGTDWGRDTISKTLWVDIWKAEVASIVERFPEAIIVCDDVRFDNEAEMLKSMGGVVIKITSAHSQNRIDTTSGIKHHSSENGISASFVDCEIENNDTKYQFENKITEVYKEFGIIPNKKGANNGV